MESPSSFHKIIHNAHNDIVTVEQKTLSSALNDKFKPWPGKQTLRSDSGDNEEGH